MAGSKSYRMLCPISRALDHVGDRWTLLILRDLHAGPARFSDLQSGLKGMASNLLTNRLQQLQADGLVLHRDGDFGVALYELSQLGRKSADLLYELARFGSGFAAPADPRDPGNMRSIAITLQSALQRVARPGEALLAGLRIDTEEFTIRVADQGAEVRLGLAESPEIHLATSYLPFLQLSDGEIPLDRFLADHAQLTVNSAEAAALMESLFHRVAGMFQQDREELSGA